MPYMIVMTQEEDHVETLQRLFHAYGLMPDERSPGPVVEAKSLKEALELAVKTEEDLIPRYLWLVQKAEDRVSARVLNRLLLQIRINLAMFQHAISMGGQGMGPGMGPGMTGRGMSGSGYGAYGMGATDIRGCDKKFAGGLPGYPFLQV